MLTKTKMQEIQDLKLQGYTKADIIRYYEAQGRKPPSRPTLSKYYDMDVIPDDPGAKLAKPKTFDVEPFRSTIVRILETNSGKSFCMSSVYDVLEEKFIENGDYEKLPGNQQTLRNYIHYLEDSGQINREPEHRRIYDYVFDTPPGEQMLIDFGEQTLSKTKSIHFICLLLRYSRFYASMHRITSITRKKPVRRSIIVSAGLEDVLKSWSSTRTPCLSPVKPMAKSSRPGPLKISVPNRISDSGYAIKRILKARDLSKTLLGREEKLLQRAESHLY